VSFGYEGRPADSFSSFDYDTNFVDYVETHDRPRPNWNQIVGARPTLLKFLYRQSTQNMVATGFHEMLLTPGMVDWSDPPPILSGMIRLHSILGES